MDGWTVRKVLVACLLFRLINSLLVQTWFVPDEFWQSQEVAHKLTFDYGHLTWEWRAGIRSYAYPLVFVAIYRLLAFWRLDNTVLMVLAPRLFQATLTACGDVLLFVGARRLYNKDLASKVLLCRLISWFGMYMCSRTLTNGVEEFFTIVCLTLFSQRHDASFWLLHVAAFTSFVVRPTAAINLIPIYVYQFFVLAKSAHTRFRLFYQFLIVGTIILLLNVAVDSHFHGDLLISAFRFLKFNVLQSIGDYYGTHPWHWYLTQGFPILMFTLLVPFVVGTAKHVRELTFPLAAIAFNIFVYSLLSHKEFRFLHQIMPFAMFVCAFGLVYLQRNVANHTFTFIVSALSASNIVMALLLSLGHQRAPISLMNHLRQVDVLPDNSSLLFLTPCHATPYYSYLHRNVSMRFLTCEPDWQSRKQANVHYKDETNTFYADPGQWCTQNEDTLLNATHIVLYQHLYNELLLLDEIHSDVFGRFVICAKYFDSIVQLTERMDRYLLLLCRAEFYVGSTRVADVHEGDEL